MKDKQIIELLKSGNFTVIYWDQGAANLYEGKLKIEDFEGELGSEIAEIEFPEFTSDYLPKLVALLVKALGGKALSI